MQIVRVVHSITLGFVFGMQAQPAQLNQTTVGCLSGRTNEEIGQQLTSERKTNIMLASRASSVEILKPRDASPTVYRSDRVIILITDDFIIRGILCE
jgi:hypothetical protein